MDIPGVGCFWRLWTLLISMGSASYAGYLLYLNFPRGQKPVWNGVLIYRTVKCAVLLGISLMAFVGASVNSTCLLHLAFCLDVVYIAFNLSILVYSQTPQFVNHYGEEMSARVVREKSLLLVATLALGLSTCKLAHSLEIRRAYVSGARALINYQNLQKLAGAPPVARVPAAPKPVALPKVRPTK